MDNANQKKQYLIVGGVIIVLVAVIGFMMFGGKGKEQAENKESVFEEPSDVIPTVDSSVQVSIDGATEAVITVKGIPEGTTEIEYQLTYNKKNLIEGEGLQDGVFGRIEVDNEDSVEEEVTFGTCSSGVCRYHDIDGPVKGTFKFSGSYGQKLLEKEFMVN